VVDDADTGAGSLTGNVVDLDTAGIVVDSGMCEN